MTVPAPRVRRRPSVPGRVLPLLLALALVAPLGLLFAVAEGNTSDDHDLASRERLGVRYLRALGPVTDALVEAQSTAVAGAPVSRTALNAAIEQVAQVDDAVGDELRSHERWAGLRAKLEGLPDRGLADPEAAYVAYGEANDLLLALYRKVRESSGLIRDPEPDSFFLQDGISGDLPTATVLAARLADLVRLAPTRPAAQRARTGLELAELRAAAFGPANDLVADLRAAVDSSESTDLGANVLTPLDAYQRSLEAFTAAGGGQAAPNPNQLTAAGITAQAAAKQLRTVILDQLDRLLEKRLDSFDRDRLLARVAAGVAIALLIGLALTLFRRQAARTRPATDAALPPAVRPDPPATARDADRRPVGVGAGAEAERWRPFDAAR
ncbi:hypothetical protein [Micromonospora robiginosa]|uniref:Nitrate/nitrite sensing protein n=1 Tax=Micromonospora robiginosa TaxID=2749844 RepID=A0A7L6B8C6_9ACTN|nr:hypothetical protein [Micromonospora ferruginea]QLQ38184.1 hypothetical protein H1D33_04690 [Micromonospora ferruginea]